MCACVLNPGQAYLLYSVRATTNLPRPGWTRWSASSLELRWYLPRTAAPRWIAGTALTAMAALTRPAMTGQAAQSTVHRRRTQ